jgi:dTDP-4-amino-4,6-dideoxygalactose transaminase
MLSKTAEIDTNFKKHIVFTESARSGWQLILESLPADATVLLPSYIGVTEREGSGIYDPVVQVGLDHEFYQLNDDLSVSTKEIEKQLSSRKYDLILLVHYFGFKIQNIASIAKLCQEHDLIVVEDCAHLYNYNINHLSDAGSYGDFVFYSLHKNFPFESGGLLIQNNLNLKRLQRSKLKYNFNERLIEFEIHNIAQKRINNFTYLDKLLSEIDGVSRLRKLGQGDIPHTYPILIKNNLREKLYFLLIKLDMPVVALYYRLIEPLMIDKFEQMQYVSNNILNLPIHQDVDKEDLLFLVKLIKQALMELK